MRVTLSGRGASRAARPLEGERMFAAVFTAVGALGMVFMAGISWVVLRTTPEDSAMRWIAAPLFLAPGIFLAVGLYVGRMARKRAREIAWLRSRGQPVRATVVGVVKGLVKHSGRMIVHIAARWESPKGDVYTFQSGPIDLAKAHGIREGDDVEVLVDPADPTRHVFALSTPPEGVRVPVEG